MNNAFLKVIFKSLRFVLKFLKYFILFLLKYSRVFLKFVIEFIKSGKLKKSAIIAYDFLSDIFFHIVNFIKNFEFNLKNIFIIIYSGFTLLVILALILTYNINYRESDFISEKRFHITEGKSFNEIAVELEADSIINNAFYFKIAAKLSGKDDKIYSRTYIIKNNLNNLELLNLLTNPDTLFAVKFTIPEGSRIKQIGKYASAKFGINPDSFLTATTNQNLISKLGLKDKINNLEGFLFPDTYMIETGGTEKELVEILFYEFLKRVYNKYDFKSDPAYLLEIITMASIIQAETNLSEEMPIIAGVYYNRLNRRMKLEADPTVQYVIPDGPKQRLLKEDLKFDSPYNTYKKYGLPPSPINNPGINAIEAALNPAVHNYLFFVATGKGGHKFSATYFEHLKAVKEYRENVRNKNQ